MTFETPLVIEVDKRQVADLLTLCRSVDIKFSGLLCQCRNLKRCGMFSTRFDPHSSDLHVGQKPIKMKTSQLLFTQYSDNI
jgi:hypothetical protein